MTSVIRPVVSRPITTPLPKVWPFCRREASAFFIFTILVVASAGIAVAQQQDSGSRDDSVYAELAKAPPKAAARQNPFGTDPRSVAAGAKLFELHCAKCHGETAEGSDKAPGLRSDAVHQATSGTLFWILTNGVVRRGMPVWSKLPEPQRWQIVAYIKSLEPGTRPSAPMK